MDAVNLFWNLVPITLVQSLVYAFVAMAVMIPFRLLSVPDLSSEGVFPLGACVAAALIANGIHPLPATLISVAAGFLAGVTTALIHLKFRVHSLLAGILTITMLWSINLRILGKPNEPIFEFLNLFDWISPAILLNDGLQIGVLALLLGGLLLALWLGLRTHVGLALRGVGANAQLAPALGVNLVLYTSFGLGIASCFSALAGSLLAQLQGYADVGMGVGMLVNGLASVIIGEALVGRRTLMRQVLAPVVGAVAYYQLASLALSIGLEPSDLKIATGLFVLLTIGWPVLLGRKPVAGRAF